MLHCGRMVSCLIQQTFVLLASVLPPGIDHILDGIKIRQYRGSDNVEQHVFFSAASECLQSHGLSSFAACVFQSIKAMDSAIWYHTYRFFYVCMNDGRCSPFDMPRPAMHGLNQAALKSLLCAGANLHRIDMPESSAPDERDLGLDCL